MLVDKYNMTMEENILYAKRNIVDSIWKSANLEGITVTFLETQAIFDGANVGHLRIDEIQAINNLKHAWQYIVFSMNAEMNLKFIESIHAFVGANIVEQPGRLRTYEVSMGGTKWKPELPSEEKIEDLKDFLYERCLDGIQRDNELEK